MRAQFIGLMLAVWGVACQAEELPWSRDEVFAADVLGTMLSFSRDGFIFESDEGRLTRSSWARGTTRLEHHELAFRPAGYHRGEYIGIMGAQVVRGPDPRLPGQPVGAAEALSERTLLFDGTRLYGVDHALVEMKGDERHPVLSKLPVTKWSKDLGSHSQAELDRTCGSVFVHDLAAGEEELYFTYGLVQAHERGGCASDSRFGDLYAVRKDGSNARRLVEGERMLFVATDDAFVYYSDVDTIYRLSQRGHRHEIVRKGSGLITALGVTDNYVYYGVLTQFTDSDDPVAHRSTLHRVKKPKGG